MCHILKVGNSIQQENMQIDIIIPEAIVSASSRGFDVKNDEKDRGGYIVFRVFGVDSVGARAQGGLRRTCKT